MDKDIILLFLMNFNIQFQIKGIQNAFDGIGAKTVIPRKVIGKFSIRIVPNQDAKKIEQLVVDYLEKKFKELNSPNKFK